MRKLWLLSLILLISFFHPQLSHAADEPQCCLSSGLAERGISPPETCIKYDPSAQPIINYVANRCPPDTTQRNGRVVACSTESQTCRSFIAGTTNQTATNIINISPPPTTFASITPRLQIPIPTFKGFSNDVRTKCLDTNIQDEGSGDGADDQLAADSPDADAGTVENTESSGCDNEVVDIPYIGEYFSAIYGYLVSIAGIVAGIIIVIAGFQWLIAAGNAAKISEAKKRIANAVVGLILALGSYTVLFLVNPDLVTFKALRLAVVQREELPQPETATMAIGSRPPGTSDDYTQVPIITLGVNGAGQVTTKSNLEALKTVGAIMYNNYGLQLLVASGARPMPSQLAMVVKRCQPWNPSTRNYQQGQGCKVATLSKPEWWLGPGQPNPAFLNDGVHLNALDIHVGAKSGWKKPIGYTIPENEYTKANGFAGKVCRSCGGIGTIPGRACRAADPCQQAVMVEMMKAGFGVLLNVKKGPCGKAFEPWHFQKRPDGAKQGGTVTDIGTWRNLVDRATAIADGKESCK